MGHFEPDTNHRIWQVVAEIPAGQVCTYGLIARRAGLAGAARRVGAALRQLPADSAIPWHRVINAQGRIAFPEGSEATGASVRALNPRGSASNSQVKSTWIAMAGNPDNGFDPGR